MVNCYTALNLTKIDVLDSFREIKVAVGYKIDGELIDSFPADLELLNRAEVEYETLQGWNTTTTGTTQWEKLPENAKKYVEFIENFLGGEIKCKYIGTGKSNLFQFRGSIVSSLLTVLVLQVRIGNT